MCWAPTGSASPASTRWWPAPATPPPTRCSRWRSSPRRSPEREITWALRGTAPARTYGGGAADALPARGALGSRLRALVDAGQIALRTGFSTQRLIPDGDRVTVVSRDPAGHEQKVTVDRIVAATGYRPDHGIAAELRLDLDPILGATRALAPLIDPNQHSCGTVPPHGVDELAHPEPGYYAIGVKSYGRAPTFLLATGYEQARSVVAALAGDWAAARDVRLELPETGVCSTNLAAEPAANTEPTGGGGLAAPRRRRVRQRGAIGRGGRGLATGVAGGLLAVPLVDVTPTAGGCCS